MNISRNANGNDNVTRTKEILLKKNIINVAFYRLSSINQLFMMKLYSKTSPMMEQPRPEIIQYLLYYSNQMRVVKTNENNYIELHLN